MKLCSVGEPSVRSVALTVTLALIAGLSGWAVWSTGQAADDVAHVERVADGFEQVSRAIGKEEGLRLRYGSSPAGAAHPDLAQTAAAFAGALDVIRGAGDRDARLAAGSLAEAHARYRASFDSLVAAVDGGDAERARASASDTERIAREIADGADAAAIRYRADAAASLDQLGASRAGALAVMLATLACGIALGSLLMALLVPARRGAVRDTLTGLGNHRAFEEALRRTVADAAGNGRHLALARIDLDDFKDVNEQLGHRHGDEQLVRFAAALRRTLGGEPLFRTGGDEFAIIIRDSDAAAARIRVERMRIVIKGRTPDLRFSAGIAGVPPGQGDANTLSIQADAALAEAKRRGKRQVIAFDEVGSDAPAVIPAGKVQAVRRLLAERRVSAAFQPIWSVEHGRILAYEALSRPDTGNELSGPMEAFDVADRIGLTDELDALCRQVVLRRARELPRGALLFLNVSPQVLDRGTLKGAALAQAVIDAGLRPERVVIEITERTGPRLAVVVREAKALREYGFRLALDDVGAGNAGLEMLRQLPVDFVKIDREVIVAALTNMTARAVFAAIVAFARESRSLVVAEGIEDEAMLDFVVRSGAHAMQGYLLGRPSDGFALAKDLTAERRWLAAEQVRPVPPAPVRT